MRNNFKEYNALIIEHSGIIKQTDKDTILVGIVSSPACSGCQAKKSCTMSDSEEKIIEINESDHTFTPGEEVAVYMESQLGLQATFLAYIIPFLLILTTLLVCHLNSVNEGVSGLLALGGLIPYYLIIYAFRNRLKKKFSISIKKNNTAYI